MLDIHEVDGVRQTSLPIAEDNPAVVEAGKVQSKLHKTRGGRKGGNMLQDRNRKGIKINRIFTRGGSNPFDMVEWEKRRASIVGDKGELIFVQDNVEVPKDWQLTLWHQSIFMEPMELLRENILCVSLFTGWYGQLQIGG